VFSERYLAHLAVYIHSNPLDMISPFWRSASLPIKELLADLMNYKWSSLYDWKTREENFTRRSARLFGSLEDHLELVKGYLIGSQMEPFKIGSWLC